jgi:hypothetical protein
MTSNPWSSNQVLAFLLVCLGSLSCWKDHLLRIFAAILKAFFGAHPHADIEVGIPYYHQFCRHTPLHPTQKLSASQHHMSTSKLDCSCYNSCVFFHSLLVFSSCDVPVTSLTLPLTILLSLTVILVSDRFLQ